MVPIHASLGLANFWLAIATSVTGLIEKERETVNETNVRYELSFYTYSSQLIILTIFFPTLYVHCQSKKPKQQPLRPQVA